MSTKQCIKCPTQHLNSGLYCSRSCANKRIHSAETKRRISEGVIERFNSLTEDEQYERRLKSSISMTKLNQDRNDTGLAPISMRRRILSEQDNKCNRCDLDTWCGEKLIFELEHIDGNNKNNDRNNLELLCPNCHSLTKTWRGRNKIGTTNKQIPVNGFKSIRQYLISIGLTPKGANYAKVKKDFGL